MRIPFICGLVIFVMCAVFLFFAEAAFANELFEVTVKARGTSRDEALASALDEAIRRGVGAIFTENTRLDGGMLEEKLIQFSRGTATNYEILEADAENGVVELTVLVTVDFTRLKENARVVKEGTAAGIEHRQTPLLELGQKAIKDFMQGLRYEDFLEAGLENQQADIRKGVLTVTVSLKFNRERYIAEFANPLAKVMNEIFASPALQREIEDEYEYPADRFAAFFHLLGENFSSGVWTLPRNFYETLKREARFQDAGKGRIQTHKRVWLHFSLLDATGTEIERLPVHLGATNVLFFSEERREPTTPWFFMGVEQAGLKSAFTLTAAPRFAALTGNGYEFYESFTQSFAFNLPENLLKRVNSVKIALELER